MATGISSTPSRSAESKADVEVLQTGGTAVDAVEAAVCVLEEDPNFNAGRGSKLTLEGHVEMDAAIMAGDLSCGAVGCVQSVAHPIRLARLIMEKTEHVLMVGEGAERLARELGVERVDNATLVTERSSQQLEREKMYREGIQRRYKDLEEQDRRGRDLLGTVGAVAVDSQGHVAFATSTGGLIAKRPGRVGDTPCIGSGGYADDEVGAVSTTGHGEAILKVCLAKRITDLMQQGVPVAEASKRALEEMRSKTGSLGGVIAVGRDGSLAFHFTTEAMSWAWVRGSQLHYGVHPGEDFSQPADLD